jgi:hypothetical protein
VEAGLRVSCGLRECLVRWACAACLAGWLLVGVLLWFLVVCGWCACGWVVGVSSLVSHLFTYSHNTSRSTVEKCTRQVPRTEGLFTGYFEYSKNVGCIFDLPESTIGLLRSTRERSSKK